MPQNSKIYFYSYNPKSEAIRSLAKETGFSRIKNENSNFKPHHEKIIINWGSSECPKHISGCKIVNQFKVVSMMSNKLSFFREMKKSIRTVPYTEDINEAVSWLKEGNRVCARQYLNSSGGKGLTVMEPGDIDRWVRAKLYTRYIPKKDEYRLHFAFGDIIDIQRKALRADLDRDEVNFQIRNLENGFIYIRNNIRLPDDVLTQGEKTAKMSGLDFGAIDILWNEKNKKAYVLEVNTAPGLEGTTLQKYAHVFKTKL